MTKRLTTEFQTKLRVQMEAYFDNQILSQVLSSDVDISLLNQIIGTCKYLKYDGHSLFILKDTRSNKLFCLAEEDLNEQQLQIVQSYIPNGSEDEMQQYEEFRKQLTEIHEEKSEIMHELEII